MTIRPSPGGLPAPGVCPPAARVAGGPTRPPRPARGRYAKGYLTGLRHLRSRAQPPPNDETLKAKVESEVLSRRARDKGRINVSTTGGVVELRGTLDTTEEISEIEQQVRKVTGVIDVRNYLHTPGTPATP